MRRKLFTAAETFYTKGPPFKHGGGGGGHVGRSCLLRAVGRGRRKKGAKPMRPRPLCPAHAKLFFCEIRRLRAGGDLRKKRSFAKFALCGRHRRHRAWKTLALSGRSDIRAVGCLIVLHGAIGGRSDIRAAGCFIVLGADTPPHTPKQSCSMGAEKVKGSGAKRPAASGALDFLGYPMQYPA